MADTYELEMTHDEVKRVCIDMGGRTDTSDMIRRKVTQAEDGRWVVRLSKSEVTRLKGLRQSEGNIDGGSTLDQRMDEFLGGAS
jgi:hypothetical protein